MTAVADPTGTLATALENATRLLRSDPTLAAEQAGEIVKMVPGHPMARLILGMARREPAIPSPRLKCLSLYP